MDKVLRTQITDFLAGMHSATSQMMQFMDRPDADLYDERIRRAIAQNKECVAQDPKDHFARGRLAAYDSMSLADLREQS